MNRKWISLVLTGALSLSLLVFPAAGATVGDREEAAGLSGLSVGDKITVSLNGAGEVRRAWDGEDRKTTVIGVLEGHLCRVNPSEAGKVSVTSLSGGTGKSLDVKGKTLGSLPLSEKVKIYDQVGAAPVVEVALEDILTDTVSADKIAYVGTDEEGKVDLLLLKDVTGDAYTYGIYRLSKVASGREGSADYAQWQTVALENGTGTSPSCASIQSLRETYGGLAMTAGGKIAGFQSLTEVEKVARTAFDGEDSVVLEGLRVPIAGEAQVYNEDTETWIDLETAKGYSDTLKVYYSGSLGGDAKVRVVAVGE